MQIGEVLQYRMAGGMSISTGFLLLEVVLLMAARGEAQVSYFKPIETCMYLDEQYVYSF